MTFSIQDDTSGVQNISTIQAQRYGSDNSGSLTLCPISSGAVVEAVTILPNNNAGFGGMAVPLEDVHAADTVRADVAFNLNGTDGISNSSAGVPTAITISGGIVTAITKNDYLDQAVKTTSSPGFSALTLSSTQPLLLTDPGVDHGITGFAPTNAYASFDELSDDAGGCAFRGYMDSDANAAFLFGGYGSVALTNPHILFQVGTKSGTTITVIGDTETAVALNNNNTRLFTVLGNGKFGIGINPPTEGLEVAGKIRANTAFNLNGADGVTAGPYTTITSITVTGGIITAITGS